MKRGKNTHLETYQNNYANNGSFGVLAHCHHCASCIVGSEIALRSVITPSMLLCFFTLHSHNSTYAMCCAIKGKCYFVLLILSSISPSSTEIKTDAYFFQCLIFINRCACGFRVVFFPHCLLHLIYGEFFYILFLAMSKNRQISRHDH